MEISDEIVIMRDKLNRFIIEDKSYEQIYKLSLELDDLITSFYEEQAQDN